MTDAQNWQPPVPPVVPPAFAPPGPVGPPAASPPPPVMPLPPSGGAPGWVAPPRPGLVPLRPLTLGDILGGSFRVLRRNPRPTLGASLVINLGILVIVSLVTGLITMWALGRIENAATAEDQEALVAGSIAFGVIGVLLVMLLSIVGTALLQGIVIAEVARATVGERLRFAQLWAQLRGRFGALVGWGFLLGAGIGLLMTVAAVILIAIGAGLATVGGDPVFVALGIVAFVIVGGAAATVLVMWLSTKTAFVTPAIVLERRPVFESVQRSWRMTRGRFWRTLGILLLVLVMVNLASQVVATPVSFAGGIIIGLLAPQGVDDTGYIVSTVIVYLVSFVVTTVVAAIGLVIQSATSSLLYIDARMRSEGLDLELARFVEARAAGTVLGDPYAVRTES